MTLQRVNTYCEGVFADADCKSGKFQEEHSSKHSACLDYETYDYSGHRLSYRSGVE